MRPEVIILGEDNEGGEEGWGVLNLDRNMMKGSKSGWDELRVWIFDIYEFLVNPVLVEVGDLEGVTG